MPGPLLPAALLALASASGAQSDQRDVLKLESGASLTGRVLRRFDPGAVTIRTGKGERTIPLAEVATIETVRDRVGEFFRRLDKLPNNVKYRWFVAQWAASQHLPELARLTALDIVLRDPSHGDAHRFLGHRQRGDRWLWPADGEWLAFERLEKLRSRWTKAWRLDGEHFRLRSNAGLRQVVDLVWDLERFHLAWFDRFGEPLRLFESVGPRLEFEVWRSARRFPGNRTAPGRSAGKNPFFTPGGGKGGLPAFSRTYFETAAAARPVRLFEVATSHLLYATVAGSPDYQSGYRPGAWAELGLARYLQRSSSRDSGTFGLGDWQLDADAARRVLEQPRRSLRQVAQGDTKKLWGAVSDDTIYQWAASELAVAYFLEAAPSPVRNGFFGYVREVLRRVKGNSSSALDRQLGQPIESLDEPWRAWIRQRLAPKSGQGSPQSPGK